MTTQKSGPGVPEGTHRSSDSETSAFYLIWQNGRDKLSYRSVAIKRTLPKKFTRYPLTLEIPYLTKSMKIGY